MRCAGFTLAALLVAATVALAQPPAVPGAPPVPPTKAADPKLDEHLAGWEKKMAAVVNLRAEISLKRTDAVFKKDVNFGGPGSIVLCMKPNFAVLRLDNVDDKTKTDYEAYICDGKAVYAYNGVQKTITKFDIPKNQPGVDNLMLDFLSGMKARDVKERFDINLFKTDEHYIYLDIKPLRPADQREFAHLRLALYGPSTKYAYLPAQVYMLKPGGDSELWKFTNPQVDIPGVVPDLFKFVPVKGWDMKQAPPAPMGGAAVPAGGAVRPNKP